MGATLGDNPIEAPEGSEVLEEGRSGDLLEELGVRMALLLEEFGGVETPLLDAIDLLEGLGLRREALVSLLGV